MVKGDFECGMTENDYDELKGLLSEGDDFTGVEDEATSYYMELLEYGPAGFLEAFRDEFDDWDPDYIAEYGDEDWEDEEDEDWDEEDEEEEF